MLKCHKHRLNWSGVIDIYKTSSCLNLVNAALVDKKLLCFLRGASSANLVSQLLLTWGYTVFFSESHDFSPNNVAW